MCRDRGPGTNERVRALKERLWQLDAEVTHWYENYVTLYKATFRDLAGLELLLAGKDNPKLQVNLPDVLVRQGVSPLYSMTIYWTCCTILYDKIVQVYQSFPAGTPTEAALLEAPRLNVLKYSICLARSTKILSQPDAGLALNTLFSGTAVACVASAHSTRHMESKTEQEDMEELERCSQGLVGGGGSIWSQTWRMGMTQMKRRHDRVPSELGSRFWVGGNP
jgi:hypothetical protein